MTPVRILYCIDRLDRGGTESQLAGLVRRLDRDRFRPRVCTLRGEGELASELDCPVIDLGMGPLLRPAAWSRTMRLRGYLRDDLIDVVQTFFQDATLVGQAAARAAGVPVRIASFRDLGFWRSPGREFALRRAYRLATGFLANSRAVADHFRERDGLPAGKFEIIHNGIDPLAVEFADHAADPSPAVALVANLNRRVKRPDLFLEAAALAARERPDVVWTLVGDGELRPVLEARAADLGIAGSVRFAGRVADVPRLLGGIAVGVNCSDSEGFANSLLEYMLAGCAVVATDVAGNREIVRDRETGLLVPPDDPPALAAAIGDLLDHPRLRADLAARARTEAVSRFGWDDCVESHQRYYLESLAAARGGRGPVT